MMTELVAWTSGKRIPGINSKSEAQGQEWVDMTPWEWNGELGGQAQWWMGTEAGDVAREVGRGQMAHSLIDQGGESSLFSISIWF